jgi:hypothetical protein
MKGREGANKITFVMKRNSYYIMIYIQIYNRTKKITLMFIRIVCLLCKNGNFLIF